MALTSAIQEANFSRQLFADMTLGETKSVSLYADNQGAIELAKNPVHHQRTKHMDIRYHYIRNEIRNRNVLLSYIPTADNKADMFTMAVSRGKLDKFKITFAKI